MKEIIYIQAGSFANHVGTHFWNTQESYLTHGQEDIVHNISFTEFPDPSDQSGSIFYPRLLTFDRKGNFGALSHSALHDGGPPDFHSMMQAAPWDGATMQSHIDSELIPQSEYHKRLDLGEDIEIDERDVRYWSDFNRVYYLPRTMQRLPDEEKEDSVSTWDEGVDLFARFDQDTALMEGALRLFVEECDLLQGIQVIEDAITFGSFTHAFLTGFRDEFPKQPLLVFPLLSDSDATLMHVKDRKSLWKAINDALCLRGLNELSTVTSPLQSPSTWIKSEWSDLLAFDPQSLYRTSAILGAHIECTTLPFRLIQEHGEDLSAFSSQLNWRGNTHFAELSGLFPVVSALTESSFSSSPSFNFSLGREEKPFSDEKLAESWYARRDISRGLALQDEQAYEEWSRVCPLKKPFLSHLHASAFPLPTSFPMSLFKSRPVQAVPRVRTRQGVLTATAPKTLSNQITTTVLSSVVTSSQTAGMFRKYARLLEGAEARTMIASGFLLERDDMKELVNDLWNIHDDYVDEGREV